MMIYGILKTIVPQAKPNNYYNFTNFKRNVSFAGKTKNDKCCE